jgi:hypothetical protein
MFGNRLYLKERPSSTPDARIVSLGLMVHVMICDAPASELAAGAYRAHAAHARNQ